MEIFPDKLDPMMIEILRSQLAIIPGRSLSSASPEDVILKKLQYFREGGLEKHVRDIQGVLRVAEAGIDFSYLEKWAEKLGVSMRWKQVRDTAPSQD